MKGKCIIVLVGPSGSGKTTVGEALARKGIPKLVTTTTREPRFGEQDGIDYHFRKVEALNPEDFVEQTVYNNCVYGLTKAEVNKALSVHDIVHVSLDRSGAIAMKRAYPQETIIVFIHISKEVMAERMRKRGDSEDKIYERICHSDDNNELTPPTETDMIVENVTVEKTVEQILSHLKLVV